ncbi:MAG: LytTR family DNA-binding domain-containing protein [Oscillospiraceae bacterium]|nr:LytTR family DNA-binding domain-containing protein [Oscillospiraceae bacterium]
MAKGKMNIAVCDDDSAFRESLIMHIENYAADHNAGVSVSSFSNGLELMISEVKYNLIFLDYKMGIMNGIEIAKKLRKKGIKCPIVFVTSFNEIVNEALEVKAFRLLTKPVGRDALYKVLDDFGEHYRNSKMISFVSNGSGYSVSSADIVYIEGKLGGCVVHTEGEVYSVRKGFDAFLEGVTDSFFRCHRKFCINLAFVEKVEENSVLLSDGSRVRLGKSRSIDLKMALDEFNN